MNISKSDALFLHSLLFHFVAGDVGDDVTERIRGIMNAIEDCLVDGVSDADSSDEDDVEEDEEAEEEVDHYVLASDLHSLPQVTVARADGTSVTAEFEQVDESVDLLVDGEVLAEDVSHIGIDGNNIRIHTWNDDGVHTFTVPKRLPKKWKEVLQEGLSEVTHAEEE